MEIGIDRNWNRFFVDWNTKKIRNLTSSVLLFYLTYTATDIDRPFGASCCKIAYTEKMMAIGASALQITAARPSIFLTQRSFGATMASVVHESDRTLSSKLTSSSHISSMSEASESKSSSQLSIDLKGKRAFIAGVADDNGYGWAIAKLEYSWWLPDGSLMEITKVYPLDAVFDNPEEVPEDIKANKRYAGSSNWTVQEVAESVKQDFGSIDILVHSLANGPEVTKPLLETSRKGYLSAVSAASYSYVSLLKHFLPIMNLDKSPLLQLVTSHKSSLLELEVQLLTRVCCRGFSTL